MSSDLAPYLTHPELPQFHRQLQECRDELAALGHLAKQDGLRLSLHPAAYVVLNSPDKEIAAKAVADLNAHAMLLELMELGREAVIVTHVGGLYDDKRAAMDRFVERYADLSDVARRRLVLENGDRAYTLVDTYAIHQRTGIRLILDQLHHLCNPAPDMTLPQALELALSTWPADQVPKIHYSTPRSTLIPYEQTDDRGRTRRAFREPRLSQHADLIDPFSFVEMLRSLGDVRPFDVMLECKAKDIALLRLRKVLSQIAPDLVSRYAIC